MFVIILLHWRTEGFTFILGDDSQMVVSAYCHRMVLQ